MLSTVRPAAFAGTADAFGAAACEATEVLGMLQHKCDSGHLDLWPPVL